jgi:hypothetical protein
MIPYCCLKNNDSTKIRPISRADNFALLRAIRESPLQKPNYLDSLIAACGAITKRGK